MLPNLTFPICQFFAPTALDGQLCYKLQVNRTTKGSENREGLVLILDMNEDMFVAIESPNSIKSKMDPDKFSMNIIENQHRKSAKIHIKTLSSFTAFGSGSYQMTSAKKLKGTDDFLAMSNGDKNCNLGDYEECRRKSLFEKCQCVPWELGHIQVSKYCKKNMFISSGGTTLFSRGQRLH